jgi:hypothetical protein
MMNKLALFAVNTKISFGESDGNYVSSEIATTLLYLLCIRGPYILASTVFEEAIGMNRRDSRKGVSIATNAVEIEFSREFSFFPQKV